ncbi:S-methyl-5-thioribose kinase [Aliamphritea spongicola]|uniref:S-methyl-5-thioribose kinase n=1 Tax=Aliamphritea spongicola TaxID=707589 RepID=UPI00196ADBA7|nr:S-methyl-5-thioribose kinase [Aliamphritea spongicola]MBN3561088.1 S-methyl-5-thioribose kinase [Aliamphritea spongicola]
MSFKQFSTDQDVIDFVQTHTAVFNNSPDLTVTEIGDGNINFVYRVDDGNNSLIVKQALPYIRVIGEAWPLSQDRIRIEAKALKQSEAFSPGSVPEVYHYDAASCAIIMADIGHYQNMREALIGRRPLPGVAEELGVLLARNLFYSSDFYLSSSAKKTMVQEFINPDLCQISEEVYFWDPFCDHERNNVNPPLATRAAQWWQDDELKQAVARLKMKFQNQSQVLLHGDLHTGSVFVDPSAENKVKVIDPEFAFVGPAGFDLGVLVANYLLNLAGQARAAGDPAERHAYQQALLTDLNTLWQSLTENFRSLAADHTQDPCLQGEAIVDAWLAELLTDSLGFAGVEMTRRTLGVAHVADVEQIEDEVARAEAQTMCLDIADLLIKHASQFSGMPVITAAVAELSFCR